MKVLIISDSHGLTDELALIKERHADANFVIHCGDSELPSDDPLMADMLTVRGNCDFDAGYLTDRVENLDGTRFFITHGHLYNIKMSLMNLSYKAEETDARVICFGHSHYAGAEMIGGRLFINPGSILQPRGREVKTYAMATVTGSHAAVTFYETNGHVVENLSQTFTLR